MRDSERSRRWWMHGPIVDAMPQLPDLVRNRLVFAICGKRKFRFWDFDVGDHDNPGTR